MANYLYNGVELPALPEWDKVAYPYATISAYDIDVETGKYALILYNEIPEWTERATDVGVTYRLGKSTGNKWYKYAVGVDSDWVANTPYGLLLANYVIEGEQEYRTICPVWSNTNLTDYDGSTLILASDPVPVPDPEPVPALTEGDFYKVANRQWVKCDSVKPTGSEWVTQDEYLYTKKAAEDEPVAYLYNGVRLPKLPEFDMAKYPHVVMRKDSNSGYYQIKAGKSAYLHENGTSVSIEHYDDRYINSNCHSPYDRWLNTAEASIYAFVSLDELIWTNLDIAGVMDGSDPVPVYE